MRNIVAGALLSAAVFAAPAFADDMTELAKSKQCFTCHDINKELIAPSFKSIGTKYRGVKDAEITLANTIEKGGVGHFGNATMPSAGARAPITGADAKSLAVWVLNTK